MTHPGKVGCSLPPEHLTSPRIAHPYMRTQPNKQQPRVYVLRSRAPLLGPLSRQEQEQWLDYHQFSRDNSAWGRAQFRMWLGRVTPLVLSRMAEVEAQRTAQARTAAQARQLRQARQERDALIGKWIFRAFLAYLGFYLLSFLSTLL